MSFTTSFWLRPKRRGFNCIVTIAMAAMVAALPAARRPRELQTADDTDTERQRDRDRDRKTETDRDRQTDRERERGSSPVVAVGHTRQVPHLLPHLPAGPAIIILMMTV